VTPWKGLRWSARIRAAESRDINECRTGNHLREHETGYETSSEASGREPSTTRNVLNRFTNVELIERAVPRACA